MQQCRKQLQYNINVAVSVLSGFLYDGSKRPLAITRMSERSKNLVTACQDSFEGIYRRHEIPCSGKASGGIESCDPVSLRSEGNRVRNATEAGTSPRLA